MAFYSDLASSTTVKGVAGRQRELADEQGL